MLIGEGPGPEEDAKGIPFIGKSGRELRGQYLRIAGLNPEEVYITNAIKCRQGKKDGDHPDPQDVRECARHHLPAELRRNNPDYIVTLGAVALRLFGDYDLELVHGRPLYNQHLFGWEGTVFCTYHPAAGLHESEFLIALQQDFHNLWLWRHGKLTIPEDEHPNPDYRLLRTRRELAQVLCDGMAAQGGPGVWVEVAVDTETDAGRIWCLTFSLLPGTGYMILASDTDLIDMFRAWLETHNPLAIFHNYLFDGPMLAQILLLFPRFTDTMIEAYDLGGLVPLGLKALAFRLCGMVMQDYEDVVMPHAISQALSWLQLAERTIVEPYLNALPWRTAARRCSGGKAHGGKHPTAILDYHSPTPQPCFMCGKVLPPPKMTRAGGTQHPWVRAGKILSDVMDKGVNPFKRWAAVPDPERAVLEGIIGALPQPSITQVPIAQAVVYACRDADATIRVKHALRRQSGELVRSIRQGVM
jgi:uracil-DNA glycosylase family 4